jgi:NAD(P)H-quinone oxidoreductase subunit 6
MALIGAVVLARREFLPDESTLEELQPPALTMPERPRELVPAGGNQESEL